MSETALITYKYPFKPTFQRDKVIMYQLIKQELLKLAYFYDKEARLTSDKP